MGVVWNGVIGNVFVFVDRDKIKKVWNIKIGDIIIGGGWIVFG